MSNLLLEQLQRDAKKVGAFQAKIAYAQYLIQNSSDKIEEAGDLLFEVCSNETAPSKYRANGFFWYARYFEQKNEVRQSLIKTFYESCVELATAEVKESELYSQACRYLQLSYEKNDTIKHNYYKKLVDQHPAPSSEVVLTKGNTPEFLYKELHFSFERKAIDINHYRSQLIALMKHYI